MEAEIEFSHEKGGRLIVRVSGDYRHVEVEDPSSGIVVKMDADLPETDPGKCNCSRQVLCDRLLGIVAVLDFLRKVVPLILDML